MLHSSEKNVKSLLFLQHQKTRGQKELGQKGKSVPGSDGKAAGAEEDVDRWVAALCCQPRPL